MALRIAGDPDLRERMPDLVHRLEQRQGPLERAGRLLRVACDHEHVTNPQLIRCADQLRQVRATLDEPSGEMRDDRVPVAGEPLDEIEGRLDPLDR